MTLVADGQDPDVLYDQTRLHFGKQELADLTLAVAANNAWNRLSSAGRTSPTRGKRVPAVAIGGIATSRRKYGAETQKTAC